jgi:hypothetical protein
MEYYRINFSEFKERYFKMYNQFKIDYLIKTRNDLKSGKAYLDKASRLSLYDNNIEAFIDEELKFLKDYPPKDFWSDMDERYGIPSSTVIVPMPIEEGKKITSPLSLIDLSFSDLLMIIRHGLYSDFEINFYLDITKQSSASNEWKIDFINERITFYEKQFASFKLSKEVNLKAEDYVFNFNEELTESEFSIIIKFYKREKKVIEKRQKEAESNKISTPSETNDQELMNTAPTQKSIVNPKKEANMNNQFNILKYDFDKGKNDAYYRENGKIKVNCCCDNTISALKKLYDFKDIINESDYKIFKESLLMHPFGSNFKSKPNESPTREDLLEAIIKIKDWAEYISHIDLKNYFLECMQNELINVAKKMEWDGDPTSQLFFKKQWNDLIHNKIEKKEDLLPKEQFYSFEDWLKGDIEIPNWNFLISNFDYLSRAKIIEHSKSLILEKAENQYNEIILKFKTDVEKTFDKEVFLNNRKTELYIYLQKELTQNDLDFDTIHSIYYVNGISSSHNTVKEIRKHYECYIDHNEVGALVANPQNEDSYNRQLHKETPLCIQAIAFAKFYKYLREYNIHSAPSVVELSQIEENKKLKVPVIALIHIFENKSLTEENAQIIAAKYGYNAKTSGKGLYDDFLKYRSATDRKGNPDTKKKLKNKIALFESVLEHLSESARNKANDEIEILKKNLLKNEW